MNESSLENDGSDVVDNVDEEIIGFESGELEFERVRAQTGGDTSEELVARGGCKL